MKAFVPLCLLIVLLIPASADAGEKSVRHHYLYVAAPGIRNYLELGGAGLLVFDVRRDHGFVRRIDTPASEQAKPENIKGICASAATKKLYFSTLTRLYCVDLVTENTLWHKALPGGCDRMSITPDGKFVYVPSLEGPHWNIVAGDTGALVTQIETKSGAHNTVVSLDGRHMYLAGLRSPMLPIVDAHTHKIVRQVGPFSAAIRPFTVSADGSLVFVNVNGLLGFEIGDGNTGKKLHRVEVEGVKKGQPKRHGCPSHGVGLTPDEKEVWVCDAFNQSLHIFDATSLPPRQMASIRLRDQPGWITFGRDGRFAYPSTGEVIDTKTRKILARLTDEKGREVHSEKVIEILVLEDGSLIVGDQFGVGRKSQ